MVLGDFLLLHAAPCAPSTLITSHLLLNTPFLVPAYERTANLVNLKVPQHKVSLLQHVRCIAQQSLTQIIQAVVLVYLPNKL